MNRASAIPITIEDVPPGTVFAEIHQKSYFMPSGVFLTGCRFLGEHGGTIFVKYEEMIGTYKMKRPGEDWRGAWNNSGPETICGKPAIESHSFWPFTKEQTADLLAGRELK